MHCPWQPHVPAGPVNTEASLGRGSLTLAEEIHLVLRGSQPFCRPHLPARLRAASWDTAQP